MPLAKLADVYPNYKEKVFDGEDIKKYSVYTLETEEKIGEVDDALIDEQGRFRYLVIDTGFWIFGKKVLLPTGRAKIDYSRNRVYTIGLTKEQAENLPKYDDDMTVDYDYEEQVRNVYRPTATAGTATADTTQPSSDASSYGYEKEPELYDTNDEHHGRLKLYEEQLVTNKERHKAGDVAVGKRVETETKEVSVPVEKERVVIERTSPARKHEVAAGEADFKNKEVARMEVYEESADIDKKAFVREEVSVNKEVERDTVDAKEKVRREELDVDAEGRPLVHTHGKQR
jgi:uncharacterized protein (TIGR02271 family)